MEFALVGVGGVLGAWARHLLGGQIETRALDTLAVNVLGSFVFGALLVLPETDPLFFVFAIGFCGAFTTFSTFAFETVRMFETGDRQLALFNASINLVGALLGVVLGIALTSALV